jgi:hypothetical protein
VAVAVTVIAQDTYAGESAVTVPAVAPGTLLGRVLAGLIDALLAVAAVAAIVVTLRYRRFRLLAGLAAAAVLGSAVPAGWFTWRAGSARVPWRPVPARGRG